MVSNWFGDGFGFETYARINDIGPIILIQCHRGFEPIPLVCIVPSFVYYVNLVCSSIHSDKRKVALLFCFIYLFSSVVCWVWRRQILGHWNSSFRNIGILSSTRNSQQPQPGSAFTIIFVHRFSARKKIKSWKHKKKHKKNLISGLTTHGAYGTQYHQNNIVKNKILLFHLVVVPVRAAVCSR